MNYPTKTTAKIDATLRSTYTALGVAILKNPDPDTWKTLPQRTALLNAYDDAFAAGYTPLQAYAIATQPAPRGAPFSTGGTS
jgi:hypothetical protein